VEEARRNFEAIFSDGAAEPVDKISDHAIGVETDAIRARLYAPAEGQLPVVVYLHGGGWQMGSLESHDRICRSLANASGSAVFAVEYRRPPEHPFPVAPNDCFAGLQWIAEHGAQFGLDTTRLAIAGDSAGGNLAAAATLIARERCGPGLLGQVLFYPATTMDIEVGFDLKYEGNVLYRDECLWHQDAYLKADGDAEHPLASPLNADLQGLPPALVITAGYDPLHRQGELYAARLAQAGVAVSHVPFPAMIHGFAQLPELFDDASQAIRLAADHLRGAFATHSSDQADRSQSRKESSR
jgi:acetyl esterase